MNERFPTQQLIALALTGAIFSLPYVAMAADAPAAPAAETKIQGSAAMRVERDPQTGALRPSTQPLSAEEQTLLSADPSKVTLETKTDGTRVYHLNGQGQEALVAHRRADGKLELTCTDNVEGALASKGKRDEQ